MSDEMGKKARTSYKTSVKNLASPIVVIKMNQLQETDSYEDMTRQSLRPPSYVTIESEALIEDNSASVDYTTRFRIHKLAAYVARTLRMLYPKRLRLHIGSLDRDESSNETRRIEALASRIAQMTLKIETLRVDVQQSMMQLAMVEENLLAERRHSI